MPLTRWIAKLERVDEVASKAFEKAVQESEDTLVELQKERMDIGLDVNGQPIEYNKPRKSKLNSTGAYTNSYAKKKERSGKQTRYVDLKNTGAYQNSLKAKVQKQGNEINVDIESSSNHAKYIEKNYNDIYGLDKFQQREIEKEIQEEIESTVKIFLSL